jgi:Tol biopolymer transport system component
MRRLIFSGWLLLTAVGAPLVAQTGAVLTTASVGVVKHVALSAIPANARIVFHTNQVIYTMDAAGGNITQITFNQGRALDHVAVSPDRLRVVASYQVSGIDHLVLFDLVAGTEQELLPHFYAAGAGGVDWDLAGNIYFAGVEALPYPNPVGSAQLIANAAAYDIYRVKYDGTGTLRVTNTSDHGESDVSVSADGTLIAYESTHLDIAHNDPTELWINTVTGTKPQRVYEESSPATRSVHDPELSPDNTKLVFSRVNPAFHNFPLGANTAHDLYTIKTDGTALTLITVPGPISIIPDWKGTSIVYLELSDEAVDYLGVSTISDTGTGHTRINGDANTPKWIETASVPAVPPPAPPGPTPASLRVQKISWSIDANPANDPAIVTAAAYRANTTGQIAAYAKAREAGVDHLQLVVKWNEVEATLGVYDFSKVDTLVANSGELPLVLNIAPIWDDGNTVLPGGLAFGNFTDAAVVTAYQNMLTALQSHLKGRLYVLIVGNEVDTYLTTASRRAQYGVFLTQVRAWARTLFGVNPFKVTASLRSPVAATWSDWADIDAATDLNCFTYYPTVTSPIENFAPQIQSDLGTMTGTGPLMFQELGLSTTISGSSEALQTAATQVLSG